MNHTHLKRSVKQPFSKAIFESDINISDLWKSPIANDRKLNASTTELTKPVTLTPNPHKFSNKSQMLQSDEGLDCRPSAIME